MHIGIHTTIFLQNVDFIFFSLLIQLLKVTRLRQAYKEVVTKVTEIMRNNVILKIAPVF